MVGGDFLKIVKGWEDALLHTSLSLAQKSKMYPRLQSGGSWFRNTVLTVPSLQLQPRSLWLSETSPPSHELESAPQVCPPAKALHLSLIKMLRGLGFGFVGYALMSRIPRAFKELGFISPNRAIRKSTMALGCLATQRDLTLVFNTKNLFSFSILKHVFLDLLLENREQKMKPNMC